MISDIRLDHVALAVERHADAWPRYAGELAGEWRSGGQGPGFAPAQLEYANGMRLEVLEPHRAGENDFLRRFLDHNGPGPHHLTYKVADIEAALADSDQCGYTPTNVDLSDPTWKEAFLHPKDAPGVLVQLAQAEGGEWRTPPPVDLPPPAANPAALVHIAHAVRSVDDGLRLFEGLLGGREAGRGAAAHHRWLDLVWPAGRVRLLAPTSEGSPLWSWLGNREGRVHHLGFTCADPGRLRGARPVSDSTWWVDPGANLGTALLLAGPGADFGVAPFA